jgi:hypothetical protein
MDPGRAQAASSSSPHSDRATSAGAAATTANDESETPPPPADSFRQAMEQVGELKEYASHFLAAKIDGVKLSARKAAIYGALGVIALLAASTMLVTAVVLLLYGLAQAIAALLGGRMWAGNLIVGILVLSVTGVGAWLFVRRIFNASRKATVDRYERRLQRQRVQLGSDAAQRSAEQRQQQPSG